MVTGTLARFQAGRPSLLPQPLSLHHIRIPLHSDDRQNWIQQSASVTYTHISNHTCGLSPVLISGVVGQLWSRVGQELAEFNLFFSISVCNQGPNVCDRLYINHTTMHTTSASLWRRMAAVY